MAPLTSLPFGFSAPRRSSNCEQPSAAAPAGCREPSRSFPRQCCGVTVPTTWTAALDAYRYPVNLAGFVDAAQYPGWFQCSTQAGDRNATIAFETHYREHAQASTEPWLEVVYWKQYSQSGRRDRITRRVAAHWVQAGTTPRLLYDACSRYLDTPTRAHFDGFRQLFGFATNVIATAATFPAFLRPESYPMVDTRIANWVGACMEAHNRVDPAGPQLFAAPFLHGHGTVLTMADFDFMQRWIAWCRHMAQKLTAQSGRHWRARDVEMAVFYAWGDRRHGQPHPSHHLNPIAPGGA